MAEFNKQHPPSDNPPPYSGAEAPYPYAAQQPYAPPTQYYPPENQGYKASAPPAVGGPVPASAAPTQTHVIVVQQQQPIGNCPVCRRGNLVYEYTCCGIFLAIFFFPIGIICCLLMKQGRCSSCGSCH